MDPSSRYGRIIEYDVYKGSEEATNEYNKLYFPHKKIEFMVRHSKTKVNDFFQKGISFTKINKIDEWSFEVTRASGGVDLYKSVNRPATIRGKYDLDEHDMHHADAVVADFAKRAFGSASVECYINPNRLKLQSIPPQREIARFDMNHFFVAADETLHITCPDEVLVFTKNPSAPNSYTSIVHFTSGGIKVILRSGDCLIYKKI
ncbi:MAG: hypothetical protein WCF65_08595 [Parachlamydiaceae bacterium]